MLACARFVQGDVEEVRRCLAGGISRVDEVDELGCTPAHLAGAMVSGQKWRRRGGEGGWGRGAV